MSKHPVSRTPSAFGSARLLRELRGLIEQARQDVSRQVNSALVLLYWRVGIRVNQDLLHEKTNRSAGQRFMRAHRRSAESQAGARRMASD